VSRKRRRGARCRSGRAPIGERDSQKGCESRGRIGRVANKQDDGGPTETKNVRRLTEAITQEARPQEPGEKTSNKFPEEKLTQNNAGNRRELEINKGLTTTPGKRRFAVSSKEQSQRKKGTLSLGIDATHKKLTKNAKVPNCIGPNNDSKTHRPCYKAGDAK